MDIPYTLLLNDQDYLQIHLNESFITFCVPVNSRIIQTISVNVHVENTEKKRMGNTMEHEIQALHYTHLSRISFRPSREADRGREGREACVNNLKLSNALASGHRSYRTRDV